MKKFFRNVALICSIFIMVIIGINKVSADTGIYIRALRDSNGNVRWRYSLYGNNSANFVKFLTLGTNQPVYCIEPNKDYLDFSQGYYSESTGDDNALNISSLNAEKLRKLKLISYYGYGYGNHTDDSWYVATQLEMWDEIDRGAAVITQGDTSIIESNRAELRNLVNNVLTLPSFQGRELKQVIGQTIEYTDTNNVLNQYQVANCTDCNATISGNKLIVSSNKVGKATVNFKRTVTNIYNPSIIYYNGNYQKIMSFGSPDPMNANVFLNIIGGTVKIQKIDADTKSNKIQGEATFEGAKFEIYDSNKNLVGTIITDSNGYGELVVGMGEYTIKEVQAPRGYLLNDEEFKVNFTPEVTEELITVNENVIKGHALITKEYGDDEIGYLKEEGAEFEVINSKGEVVDTIITDEDGVGLVKLPFGKYTIKQTKGKNKYSIADDITVNISKNKKIYKFNVKNISYPRFEITKYDISNSKPLPGATIEIYKLNENEEYELYYSGITDKTGKIYLDSIDLGKYYFIEKNAPKGYLLNEEEHHFEITEYGKTYKETLGNDKYPDIEITKSDSKTGKALKGAKIEIYKLNEETEEYELYYSDTTDENGKIHLDIIDLGKYYYKEVEAPEGYLLNEEEVYFEISEYNTTYKYSLTNDEVIIEVPDTLTKESYKTYYVAAIVFLIGLAIILYEKTKYKK